MRDSVNRPDEEIYDASNNDLPQQKMEKPTYNTQTANKLFGPSILGSTMFGEFPCSYKAVNGKIFLGSKALCFYGNFFFFEQRTVMPYLSISSFRAHTLERDKIVIVMEDRQEHIFSFLESGGNPCAVYNTIKGGVTTAATREMDDILNLFLDLRERFVNGLSIGNGRCEGSFSTSDVNEASNGSNILVYAPPPMFRSHSEPNQSCLVVNNVNEIEVQLKRKSVADATAAIVAMADFRSFSMIVTNKEERGRQVPIQSTIEIDHADENVSEAPIGLAKAWEKVKCSTLSDFKEDALSVINLSCSLSEFFHSFISDDAPHSIENYQRDLIGDSEIETSQWEIENNTETFTTKTRFIKYRHPVNVPMSPPSAIAIKEQHLKRYPGFGFVIETTTKVKDMPLTDCFVVVDRIVVENNNIIDGIDGITLMARFELRFIKSTMFRRIIEKTTRGEFIKFFLGYKNMVQSVLEKDDSRQIDGTPTRKQKIEPSPSPATIQLAEPKEPFMSTPIVVLSVAVFVLFVMNIFLVYQVLTLRNEVNNITEDRHLQFQKESVELMNGIYKNVEILKQFVVQESDKLDSSDTTLPVGLN